MEKRTLFYWSHMFLHHNALKKGDNYQLLKPAISINLLRYNFYRRKMHIRCTDCTKKKHITD